VEAALFDFELPPEAIAQKPTERRDDAKLLCVDRQTKAVTHHQIRDLPELLGTPYAIIRNNARVLRARLRGQRETGGKVECLLLHPGQNPEEWWCLLKPGKKLPVGTTFSIGSDDEATVLDKSEEGQCLVRFTLHSAKSVLELSERDGEMPLPPYIRRDGPEDPRTELDRDRYNTVYAAPDQTVAAAAPTAGLHFTPELIAELKQGGHQFHDLTLHVGLDTFRPIQADEIEAHVMHSETYEIPSSTVAALQPNPTHPRLAVGTTSLRASEDYARKIQAGATNSPNEAFVSAANLFIYPPNRFAVEALLTNFHLPRSTLLCLVSSFLTPESTDGIEWLKDIYREALDRNYRFYSYGDAMLIS
tara:strand:- start:67457 stop:68539 length:1083 start_codon:yes stop_codon:yes gene_type:complete